MALYFYEYIFQTAIKRTLHVFQQSAIKSSGSDCNRKSPVEGDTRWQKCSHRGDGDNGSFLLQHPPELVMNQHTNIFEFQVLELELEQPFK